MHIVIKGGFYTGVDILHPIVRFNGPGHLGTLQLIPPVNTIVPPLTKCSVLTLTPLIVQLVLFILLLLTALHSQGVLLTGDCSKTTPHHKLFV